MSGCENELLSTRISAALMEQVRRLAEDGTTIEDTVTRLLEEAVEIERVRRMSAERKQTSSGSRWLRGSALDVRCRR